MILELAARAPRRLRESTPITSWSLNGRELDSRPITRTGIVPTHAPIGFSLRPARTTRARDPRCSLATARRPSPLDEEQAMKRDPCVLGIDLGTGSTKAILLDASGVELAVASVPVRLSRPRPGWVESDPENWWLSVKGAVAKVLETAESSVRAIGLSGQMHGVVLTHADGRPLRPAVLWLDRRAGTSLDAYRALQPATRALLGNPLVPGMAGPLLHWLAAEEPAVLRDAGVGSAAERLAAAAARRARGQRSKRCVGNPSVRRIPEHLGPPHRRSARDSGTTAATAQCLRRCGRPT